MITTTIIIAMLQVLEAPKDPVDQKQDLAKNPPHSRDRCRKQPARFPK